MKKKNSKIREYIPSIIAIVFFTIVIIGLLVFKKDKVYIGDKSNLNNFSSNYVSDDEEGMDLYYRYHVEDGLLFKFIGSNTYDNYYGYYYSEDREKLPSFLKNIILIKNNDYGMWDYDMDNTCYKISLDNYSVMYNSFYGNSNIDLSMDEEFKSIISVSDNDLCLLDYIEDNYTKIVDTYLVDIVRENEKIVIQEKVVFIEIEEDYYYFYMDYEMKDLVYKLENTNDVDISFIGNSEVVSNVLLEYKDKLDIYEYTYVKGVDTYYLESIKK